MSVPMMLRVVLTWPNIRLIKMQVPDIRLDLQLSWIPYIKLFILHKKNNFLQKYKNECKFYKWFFSCHQRKFYQYLYLVVFFLTFKSVLSVNFYCSSFYHIWKKCTGMELNPYRYPILIRILGSICLLCRGHGCIGKRIRNEGGWRCWRKRDWGNVWSEKCISHKTFMSRKMMKSGIEFGKEGKVALLARWKRSGLFCDGRDERFVVCEESERTTFQKLFGLKYLNRWIFSHLDVQRFEKFRFKLKSYFWINIRIRIVVWI
jgi:hypothetical protein